MSGPLLASRGVVGGVPCVGLLAAVGKPWDQRLWSRRDRSVRGRGPGAPSARLQARAPVT